MQIWRNNQIEEVDEREFHNALATTIDNAARAEGLQFEAVNCDRPKIPPSTLAKRRRREDSISDRKREGNEGRMLSHILGDVVSRHGTKAR